MMGFMALDAIKAAILRGWRRRTATAKPLRFDLDDEAELPTYTTGTGQVLSVHGPEVCVGRNCCIHKPSDHPLSTAPTHWRSDRAIMERICSHGVGHPDHDSLAYELAQGLAGAGVHGCDGCCGAAGVVTAQQL